MSKEEHFYITSPIFYPNAKPHMGNAYTTVLCDVISRAQKLQQKETYFLTGTDENTGKVVKAAAEVGVSTEEFLSQIVENFKNLYSRLHISFDQFVRTTDKERHWPGAITLWNKLVEAGDIYKAKYTGLYCPGCEAFYTEKDLIDGKCPYHLTVPEKLEEENYFFKLSKYNDRVKEAIQSGELDVVPSARKNEILALLERGLADVSFSRPIKNVPHGIPVPGDPNQVIYVWCDALVNYISAIGYGWNETEFKKWWPADLHVIGKDILRFHAAIWPAMLLSAGLPLPKKILVHGLIMSGGQKMSKTLGNVIDPLELIEKFGPEAVRYYLTRKIPTFDDGDLTEESFKDAYNGDLANGLGNLVSRVMTMAEKNLEEPVEVEDRVFPREFITALNTCEIVRAMNIIWEQIGELDRLIQETEPFKLVKTDPEKAKKIISELVNGVYGIARMLAPVMPETSRHIISLVKENKKPEIPLFVRKD